jgi:hypothetical protein
MARNAAAPSNETTWRTLLGSCDDWPIPTAESCTAASSGASL